MRKQLLRVNLSNKMITSEIIPNQILDDFLGGKGMALRYLYEEIESNSDVFDESNKLCLSVGPLLKSGCYSISCRSPLTGLWSDTVLLGRFGKYLKNVGYSMVIIEGKSEHPVYLTIDREDISIRDAGEIWGETISESIKHIQQETGCTECNINLIGPAGEKLVKTACIVSSDSKLNSRGGLGALMGSKKLKAILIAGNNSIANDDDLSDIVQLLHGDKQTVDTIANTAMKSQLYQDYKYLNTVTITETEYRFFKDFISIFRQLDVNILNYIQILSKEYGVDTITTGLSISWAILAYEKGILTRADTNNSELSRGNIAAILSILRQIFNNEGIGQILGAGIDKAEEIYGKISEKIADNLRGLELISNTEANNTILFDDTLGIKYDQIYNENKIKVIQDYSCLLRSMIISPLSSDLKYSAELSAIIQKPTGVNLLQIGERIFNLQRAFDNRFGVCTDQDVLPSTFFLDASCASSEYSLNQLIQEYYKARGWGMDGKPLQAKLAELGLGQIVYSPES